MIRERLDNEIQSIKTNMEHSSLSRKKDLYLDYENFSVLYHDLDLGCIPYMENPNKYGFFFYIVHYQKDNMAFLSDKAIRMFKDINFYSYYNDGYVKIPINEKKDLLREFLNYFNPKMIDLYNDLYNDNRIILVPLEFAGISYFAPSIDSYYILMEDNSKSDINFLCTTLHELAHVYVMKIMKHYSSHAYHNIYESFLSEVVPLYIESSFCEWMIEKNIYVDSVKLHQNFQDYFQLFWFKSMNYFKEMLNRSELTYYYDNVDYEFSGDNISLNQDKGIPFFRYPDAMKKGKFIDFKYGISSLDAYKLLEREKNGEDISKMLSDYCSKYQYFEELLPEKMLDYDFNFMKNNIDMRTKELMKKYPVPGYTVKK